MKILRSEQNSQTRACRNHIFHMVERGFISLISEEIEATLCREIWKQYLTKKVAELPQWALAENLGFSRHKISKDCRTLGIKLPDTVQCPRCKQQVGIRRHSCKENDGMPADAHKHEWRGEFCNRGGNLCIKYVENLPDLACKRKTIDCYVPTPEKPLTRMY